jgi:hypothetical protein
MHFTRRVTSWLGITLALFAVVGLPPSVRAVRNMDVEYGYHLGFFFPTADRSYGGWIDNASTSLSDDRLTIRNTFTQALRWKSGFSLRVSEGLLLTYVDGEGRFLQWVVPVLLSATYEIPVPTTWPLLPYAGGGIGAYYGRIDVDAPNGSAYDGWSDYSLSRGLHLLVGGKFFPESRVPLLLELQWESFDLAYEIPSFGFGRGEISRRGGGITFSLGVNI